MRKPAGRKTHLSAFVGIAAANRPPPSQNEIGVTKRGNRMKTIRTQVAIGIIKLAAALCGLALVIAPWPLADEQITLLKPWPAGPSI